mgnify:CR=1 FL=1
MIKINRIHGQHFNLLLKKHKRKPDIDILSKLPADLRSFLKEGC